MRRQMGFIVFLLAGIVIYSRPLLQLVKLSFDNELYSHFLLIPVVSLYFFWRYRNRTFTDVNYSGPIGIFIAAAGVAGYCIGIVYVNSLGLNDFLSISTAGFVAWVIGAFVFFFGIQALRKAIFPLFFLVFMIPVPTFILEPLILSLQVLSANATHVVFEVIGIPYLREGMFFELPGIVIEVAEECSGIRSSLALLITSVIAGHLFLETKWRGGVLALAVFPITIFKNALRITTLAVLAVYVDPSWLTDSWLHRMGGKPFFVLALFMMLPILALLRRSEREGVQCSATLEGKKI